MQKSWSLILVELLSYLIARTRITQHLLHLCSITAFLCLGRVLHTAVELTWSAAHQQYAFRSLCRSCVRACFRLRPFNALWAVSHRKLSIFYARNEVTLHKLLAISYRQIQRCSLACLKSTSTFYPMHRYTLHTHTATCTSRHCTGTRR